jgi:hypothetical protein
MHQFPVLGQQLSRARKAIAVQAPSRKAGRWQWFAQCGGEQRLLSLLLQVMCVGSCSSVSICAGRARKYH